MDNLKNELHSKWTLSENLLQSYRSISISSQSFMLVVGVFSLDKNVYFFNILFFLSLLMIWVIWFPVVVSRHRIADFYQFLYETKYPVKKENNIFSIFLDSKKICIELNDYVNKYRKRKLINSLFKLKNNWKITRIKIDFLLPLIFTIIWILLFYLKSRCRLTVI